MNILQLVPSMNVGGVETGTVDLAKKLIENGHRAIVISSGGRMIHDLEKLGVKHYTLAIDKKNPISIFMLVPKVARIILKENINIVHARSRVPAIIGFFAAKRTNTAFVTTCHGYYNKGFFSGIMGWGKYVICISQCISDHIRKNFKVSPDKIRIIHRGVNLQEYNFKKDVNRSGHYNIGIVGRITPLKGHDTFLKAMANVVRLFPNVKIFVAGDAPQSKMDYFKNLVKLTRQLGLSEYVEFIGYTKDIPALMQKLDILVLSTRVPEGFGRVIIEAFASGTCVVSTKVGGVVDIIDHEENGMLVQKDNPLEMSQAVIKLLSDRDFAFKLAENARLKTEKCFTLDKLYQETMKVYEDCLNRKRILVIKIGAVGDVVLISPSLRWIRKKYPTAHIAVLTGQKSAPIISRCPYVDEIILYPFAGRDSSWALFKLANYIRNRSFDFSIDFQNNLKTHLLSFMALIFRRIGQNNGKADFLLNMTPYSKKKGSKSMHSNFGKILSPVEHQYKLLNLLDIYPEDNYLEVWSNQKDIDKAENFLKDEWITPTTKLIGISLSASAKWLTKRWPLENFAKFCDLASKRFNARIVIVGTAGEVELAHRLMGMTNAKLISLCGKTTILELAGFMKKLNLFIGPDSACIHIASAVNVPFIALFGPTDPKRHVCACENYKVIFKKLSCGPCYKPTCKDTKCMQSITVEEVLEASQKLLENQQSKS